MIFWLSYLGPTDGDILSDVVIFRRRAF